jgi:sulfur carrier protein
MRVVVNGRDADVASGATLADVLAALGHDPGARGVAVALNGEVVRRHEWTEVAVAEGNRIEVLTAVGGG